MVQGVRSASYVRGPGHAGSQARLGAGFFMDELSPRRACKRLSADLNQGAVVIAPNPESTGVFALADPGCHLACVGPHCLRPKVSKAKPAPTQPWEVAA